MQSEANRPPLNPVELAPGLVGPGCWWKRLDVVAETGSTNADLVDRASRGEAVDATVLIAEHQTAGRCRHGRQWTSPARSQIALSFAVDAATVPTEAWGWLPLATGVAVVDALRATCGVTVGLKWPNDVLAGSDGSAGKLAGILAEVAAPQAVIVVGLGLNVTLTAAEAPDPIATSLAMLGEFVDRTVLLRNLLRELAVRVDQWRSTGGRDEDLVADYRRLSLTQGATVRASLPGDRQLTGVARGFDQQGRILIDVGAETVTVSAGDITHLRRIDD